MNRRIKYLLVFVVAVVGWTLTAPLLASYLIVKKPLANADAMIVLSGSAVYKERTRKAAELYRHGVAPMVFVTNDGERAGWSQAEQRNPPFVELEQRELIANGVLPDAIKVLDGDGLGTDSEANQAAIEIEARPIKSLLIVTSAYHSRRALRTFENKLREKGVEIGIEHAPIDDGTPRPEFWWLSPRGWQTVAGEYVKSAVYWAFY